jgi:hypothetical protein
MRNITRDFVDKMQIYFCYTRYQAAYITPVAATDIYKGLIQLPYVFQVSVDVSSGLCHCRYVMSLLSVLKVHN